MLEIAIRTGNESFDDFSDYSLHKCTGDYYYNSTPLGYKIEFSRLIDGMKTNDMLVYYITVYGELLGYDYSTRGSVSLTAVPETYNEEAIVSMLAEDIETSINKQLKRTINSINIYYSLLSEIDGRPAAHIMLKYYVQSSDGYIEYFPYSSVYIIFLD